MHNYAIIYQDEAILAVWKPAGMPVQSDKTDDIALQDQLSEKFGQVIYLVHRLDRPVSGIMVFAKTKEIANLLVQQFQEKQVKKIYWAVVQNKPVPETGILLHYLRKDQKQNRSFAFDKPLHHTKKAESKYRLLTSLKRYHVLEIELLTGRHHQIRAQLGAVKNPIKGDVKYGFKRSNRDRSIHLHARRLAIQHPVSGESLEWVADLPEGDGIWAAVNELVGGEW